MTPAVAHDLDPRAPERERMVELVRRQLVQLHREGRGPELSPRVAAALLRVPRERFVPPHEARAAYDDMPLPIEQGQTISQPLMVGLMSEVASPTPQDVVLEVGTGSGYGAAVLAELAGQVCTMEVLPALAEAARGRLASLGYRNVVVLVGDAWEGWPADAPFGGTLFHSIVVTCATPVVPGRLLEQLRTGGRMVLPLGEPEGTQMLTVVTKEPGGRTSVDDLLPVAFVTMVHGQPRGPRPPRTAVP